MWWFQNVRLINLRHLLTMVEQLIRLIVHSRSILRPPRSSKFPNRSLPPAIRPPSWCLANLLSRPFLSRRAGYHILPPPLIEFILEFLVAQFLIFTAYSSLICCDGDHSLDNFVLMCFSICSPLISSFNFFRLRTDFWFWTRSTLIQLKVFSLVLKPSLNSLLPMVHSFSIDLQISSLCLLLSLECPPQGP